MDRLDQAIMWIVEAIVAVIVFKILVPSVGRKAEPFPRNWRVERRRGEIVVTERGSWLMGLICLLLTALEFLGSLRLTHTPFDGATAWFLILALIGAFFWYAMLTGCVNRTVFTITRQGIRVQSGPLPVPRAEEWFPADNIAELHCHAGYIRGGNIYSLSFRTPHGKSRVIGGVYDQPDSPIALGLLIQEMIPGLEARLERPGTKRKWTAGERQLFVEPFAKGMACVAGAIGLLALGLAIHKVIHIRSMASSPGRVTGVQKCEHCIAPYSFYVVFQANGHPVDEYIPTDVLSAKAEGDTVTVLYDSRDPEQAELYAIDDGWIVIALIFAAALIFPSILLAIAWSGSR